MSGVLAGLLKLPEGLGGGPDVRSYAAPAFRVCLAGLLWFWCLGASARLGTNRCKLRSQGCRDGSGAPALALSVGRPCDLAGVLGPPQPCVCACKRPDSGLGHIPQVKNVGSYGKPGSWRQVAFDLLKRWISNAFLREARDASPAAWRLWRGHKLLLRLIASKSP